MGHMKFAAVRSLPEKFPRQWADHKYSMMYRFYSRSKRADIPEVPETWQGPSVLKIPSTVARLATLGTSFGAEQVRDMNTDILVALPPKVDRRLWKFAVGDPFDLQS